MVIDPSAPYASGIRAALPGVKIAVDKWHLVALANAMVTEVRQRVTRTLLGRRGTVRDPIWLNRRLLLTGAEHLSPKQWQPAVEIIRPLRPDQRDPGRVGGQGTSPAAARRVASRAGSGGGWPTSTKPRSTPSCPKRPGSPAPSRPGGPPS